MAIGQYILDENDEPVLETNLLKWGRWLQDSMKQRIVKQEHVGKLMVSTVFLGLDHNFMLDGGPPVLWETMAFNREESGYKDLDCDRCSGGRKDALAMHRRMVRRVKKGQR